ncbi:ribosomal RNA processing protein 1 homolog B isoform X1 [Monodelphis domestica]|uniref:ribosomal RNA processing protein 1 homolog B isoform X1 n=2 Tax=Monodelphis domestica TaxID=13616 RepID=UPI0024E2293E|nr:ribosomal RNA processing protein 1 homolog B isoform X1 [Monodelphis domestica]
MAPAMQPAEIQFAQRLASNEKLIRDRAAKKLRQYISVKTQRVTGGFSQEELLKIWKGLFYCMWMQDESLLQEELADTISQLIHVVNNLEAQHLFIQTFWKTMNREWKGIDQQRLDKYYMLIRLVLRQSFEVLKRNGWDESRIKLFLDVLMKEILHPESNSPNGVKFHFIDIYLDELAKVGAKELGADQNLKFIDPFCKIAAKTKDHTLVQTIAKGIFEVIVDQSPFAPEDLMEEQKTNGDSELSEEEESDNELTAKKAIIKKKSAVSKHSTRKDGWNVEEEKGEDGTSEDTGILLQFDYKAVADRLLEVTSRKNTPPFNRRRLSKLVKKFQDLSEGVFPQISFPEDISTDEDDHTLSRGRRKKKRNKLTEKTKSDKEKGQYKSKKFSPAEEETECNLQKRKRRKKKKNNSHLENSGDPFVPSEPNGNSEPESCRKKDSKKYALENETNTSFAGAEESGMEHPPTTNTQNKRKRPRKKSSRVLEELAEIGMPPVETAIQNGPGCITAQEPALSSPPAGGVKVVKKKRKLGAIAVGSNGLTPLVAIRSEREGLLENPAGEGDCPAFLAQGIRLKKKKGKLDSLEPVSLPNQKVAFLKKRKKVKEVLNLVETNGALEAELKKIQATGVNAAFSPLKKKKLKTENDFVKFENTALPKPLFFRKSKSNVSVSSPSPTGQLNKQASSGSKKVTFGLNKNMTAEFKKTDKSILVSPTGPSRVAFNPEQKPLHGVLKTPTSSPPETPLVTKKLLIAPPKRRPTAMDFF